MSASTTNVSFGHEGFLLQVSLQVAAMALEWKEIRCVQRILEMIFDLTLGTVSACQGHSTLSTQRVFEGAWLTQLVQLVTAGRLFPCHEGQVDLSNVELEVDYRSYGSPAIAHKRAEHSAHKPIDRINLRLVNHVLYCAT